MYLQCEYLSNRAIGYAMKSFLSSLGSLRLLIFFFHRVALLYLSRESYGIHDGCVYFPFKMYVEATISTSPPLRRCILSQGHEISV